jgi:protein-disulfide isomerase-like protein with CxxC motif
MTSRDHKGHTHSFVFYLHLPIESSTDAECLKNYMEFNKLEEIQKGEYENGNKITQCETVVPSLTSAKLYVTSRYGINTGRRWRS